MSRRGFFLCVEGADGVGKSTLVRRLVAEKGFVGYASPNRGLLGTGELISRYLKGEVKFSVDPVRDATAAQMVFSANMFQQSWFIEDALRNGHDVVIDRYVASAISYLSLHMEIDEADKTISRFSEGLPCPDLTIVLDMDPSKAMKRAEARGGKERYDDVKTQERVRAAFIDQYELANQDYTIMVNADVEKDLLFARVVDSVEEAKRLGELTLDTFARYKYRVVETFDDAEGE